MKLHICTVDAFTSVPFRGNPAAVCLLEEDLPDDLKQRIASEMNISETAFVTKTSGASFASGNLFGLRWFTPTNEVSLCGHATLATAKAIFGTRGNSNRTLRFETLSGILEVTKENGQLVMNLPQNKPEKVPQGRFSELVKEVCGNLPVVDVSLSRTAGKLLIRLEDTVGRRGLEGLQPDTERMMKIEQDPDVRGVIVTVLGDQNNYNFLSRYFGPWNGIPEDPVTGSAHTVLGPYWAERLEDKMGRRKSLKARQCSHRGGDLTVEVRTILKGEAVIVLEGTINC